MGNRAEKLRKDLIASQNALRNHSMNSKTAHWAVECEREVYKNDKGAKADRKNEENDREMEERVEERIGFQFDRSLTKMFDERATDDDIKYVLSHLHEYERPRGVRGRVLITVVDFTATELQAPKMSIDKYIQTLPFSPQND